jgi:putative Mn2+ efflux pump MntP
MIIQAILLGIGVSMDAFAASICNGLVLKKAGMKIISALIFGVFHFIMPLMGFLFGVIFENFVIIYATWLAFLFFCFIGGRILFEKLHKENKKEDGIINMKIFFMQAFVTSIDAMLVGIPFASFEFGLLKALHSCIIISLITFVFCFFGGVFGSKLSIVLGKRAENFGSAILIMVGIRAFMSRFF